MRRYLLPLVTLVLLGVVAADWAGRLSGGRAVEAFGARQPSPGGAPVTLPSPVPPAMAAVAPPAAPVAAGSRTPTLDRLARLAVRQQLGREHERTYLDSLLATTDSVVRRWPDRGRAPLKVALLEGGPQGYSPHMATLVRQALARWSDAGVGVGFVEVSDTSAADIIVRWIDRFDFDRAGQTDLTWDQQGRVRRATISLALRTSTGVALDDSALLAVAVHETGHAIGLPHSPDSNDVMFPSTHTASLSDRDVHTAAVLYELPPGPVRDLGGQ